MAFGKVLQELASLKPARADRTTHLGVLERFDAPNPGSVSGEGRNRRDKNRGIDQDREQCMPPRNMTEQVEHGDEVHNRPRNDRKKGESSHSPVECSFPEI